MDVKWWKAIAVAMVGGAVLGLGGCAAGAAEARAGLDWSLVAVAVLVQYPLMIAFPVVLGWWIRRRYGIGWEMFGAGALTFVASQVVHLPLNWALGLVTGDRGVGLWPLPLMALAAGLSAGLCEEIARWVALRFWRRDTRGWAPALQFGAGHGAVEAIIFGVLAAMGLVGALTMTLSGQTVPEITEYWQTPWYLFVLAGLERVFAIAFHVAAATLVMRAVTRRRIGYLVAAIALHTALNFWAVWAVVRVGTVWTEVGLGVFALACVGLILSLREGEVAA